MNTAQSSMVVAVFDNGGQAEAAIDELWHAGFPHEQIGMAAPGEPVMEAQTRTGQVEEAGASGAVVGAVTGGTVGALAGALATVLIPVIGPVLTGGFLAAIAGGTAAGAAAGAYVGPFIGMGLTKEEARYYESALKGGRTIVAVKAGDRAEEAREILHHHGGHETADLDRTGVGAGQM
jgi:hypothetical protein